VGGQGGGASGGGSGAGAALWQTHGAERCWGRRGLPRLRTARTAARTLMRGRNRFWGSGSSNMETLTGMGETSLMLRVTGGGGAGCGVGIESGWSGVGGGTRTSRRPGPVRCWFGLPPAAARNSHLLEVHMSKVSVASACLVSLYRHTWGVGDKGWRRGPAGRGESGAHHPDAARRTGPAPLPAGLQTRARPDPLRASKAKPHLAGEGGGGAQRLIPLLVGRRGLDLAGVVVGEDLDADVALGLVVAVGARGRTGARGSGGARRGGGGRGAAARRRGGRAAAASSAPLSTAPEPPRPLATLPPSPPPRGARRACCWAARS
jgi:hypothetical protein